MTNPGAPKAAGKPYWDGDKRNLVIITMDTTRADYISAYGKNADLTPHIDKLASEGTLFLRGTSQTNQTNPSHLSIMTGMFGIDHGVLDNERQMSEELDMLPLAFQRAGYHTAGFPSAAHVSKWFGWRGFDDIYDVPPDPKEYLNAKAVTDRALAWLDSNGNKPFFIWVHYYDPHAPYNPPKDVVSKFYKGNPKAGSGPDIREQYKSIKKSAWCTGVRDLAYPIALYKGEVNFSDTNIGRLLDYLDKKGLTDKTGVVLVGDHGENLGEHEMYYNHYFTFETTLDVPFIMRFPGMPAGNKVETRVTQVDIAPTVADLYGLELHNNLKGVSLVKALKGEKDAALEARKGFVHEHGNNRQIVVREGDMKIIYTITPFKTHPPLNVDAGAIWVYDLAKDPEEKNDIAKDQKQLVDKYKPFVQRWYDLKGTGSAGDDEEGAPNNKMSKDREDALKAMGYMENEKEDEEAPAKGAKGKGDSNKGKSGDKSASGLGYTDSDKESAKQPPKKKP